MDVSPTFRYAVDTVSVLILFGALIVAVYHLSAARGQIRKDHEAIRRNNALDAIRHFTELNQSEMIGATGEILDRLPVGDVKKIRSFVPTKIDPDLQPFIVTAICSSHGACQSECVECKHFFKKGEAGRVDLTLHATILLRRRFSIYFNSHEIVFSTWNSGVADKEMIVEAFEYIFEKDTNKEHSKFSEMLKRFDPEGKNFPNSKKFLELREKPAYTAERGYVGA